MNKYISILLLALLTLTLGACNSKNEPVGPEIPTDALYDIVTLADATANSTTFTLRKDGDSRLLTLVTSTSLLSLTIPEKPDQAPKLPIGTRIIISYKPVNGQAYTSGQIILYGYRMLDSTCQTMLTGSSVEYQNWKSEGLKITSLWRTGEYINVNAQCYVHSLTRPQKFVLVADEATLDKETVELHLIFEMNAKDGTNAQTVYGSFDIAKAWNLPSCKAITVIYESPSGTKSQTFKKESITPQPM